MPAYHDVLCKQFLRTALEPIRLVELEKPVLPQEELYIDVYITLKSGPPDDRPLHHLGPLADMVSEPCIIEPSSRPPSPAVFDSYQRKQMILQGQLIRDAGGRYQPRLPLWIISPGRPRQIISIHDIHPAAGWLAGFYCAAAGTRTWLVVVAELPKTPETLALRLLGSQSQRKQALSELAAIRKNHPIRMPLLEIALKLRYFIDSATDIDPEERVIMSKLDEQMRELDRNWEIYKADLVRRGQKEGELQGLRKGVLALLRARKLPTSKAVRVRIEQCTDPELLTRWLSRAAVAQKPMEVFVGS